MIRAGPEYLRISYATVLRMTKAGDLHAIRVGREFRYLRFEIDKLMRQPRQTPRRRTASRRRVGDRVGRS